MTTDALSQARALQRSGNAAAAIDAYRRILAASPDDAAAAFECALLLLQARRIDAALPLLRQARLHAPDNVDVLLVLAQVCRGAGLLDEGFEAAQAAAQRVPTLAPAWMLCGSIDVARGRHVAAESALRRAVAIAPQLAEAWHFLGESLQAQRRWDDAIAAYREAMRAQPSEIFNIGLCAEHAGRWDDARAAYRRMCELHPERADCLARCAQVEARLCEVDASAVTTERLRARLASPQPLRADDVPEPFALSWLPLPDEARRAALLHHAARVQARAPQLDAVVARPREGRLRLGYIGADFGQHAVGTLLRGLFAAHDRTRVDVIGYSLRRHHDALASTLAAEFDRFDDVSELSSAGIATQIRADGIDVLIDLAGFTHGARPDVLAARPAPVQLGWIGFIHAHEATWLDGIVFDEGTMPPDAPWPYSDRALRLPGYLLPCGPLPSGRADRARFGLPADVPVFASFNNSYKFDAELIDAWVGILRRVPDARFAVYLPDAARAGFVRQWQQRGGDAMRLHLFGHVSENEQADRAASCDLFLDAFRYQAGATALACVAAGLPLLTREGASPLARLGVSLNRVLGLDTLICADTNDYIERAVALANDPAQLQALRELMREACERTALFDPRRAAAAIEDLVEALVSSRA